MNQAHLIDTANSRLNERYSNVGGAYANAGGDIQAGSVKITPEMQQQGINLSNQILSGLLNRETVEGCGKKPLDLGPLNKAKMDAWKKCVKEKADAEAAKQIAAQQLAQQQQEAIFAASQANTNKVLDGGFFTTPTGIVVAVVGVGAVALLAFWGYNKIKGASLATKPAIVTP